MNTYGIGFDFGNSHATGVVYVNGVPRLLTVPSASAAGSLHEHASILAGSGKTYLTPFDVLKDQEYVLNFNGTEKFVGKLALSQSRKSSTGKGDINRYWSPRSLELLLTVAGALIPEDHFSLLVVSGLPVETFKSEEARSKVKKALNGTHEFVLNGRSKFATVKVGKVLMEGAGAALSLGVENSKKVGIVDIGEFTTDAYVTQGLEAVSYLCRGAEVGIANVGEYLSRACHKKYQRELSTIERLDTLRAFIGRMDYPTLSSPYGEVSTADLAVWSAQAVESVGNEVKEFVSGLWRSDSTGQVAGDFARVQIVGGGAYYLADKLTEIISENKIACSPEPEHDNARGYGWFAQQLMRQRSTERASA